MNSTLLIHSFPLFAEGTATPPAGSGFFGAMVMMFMVLIAMYLLLVWPKQSQAKKAQKMIDALKKNDKVMTTSGMIGTIHSIDKEQGEVVLKVDDSNNTKIKFSIGAVYFVFQDKSESEK